MEMGTCLRYLEAKMDNAFGTNFKFYTKYKERWQNVWNNYLEPLFVDLTAKLLNIEF